MMSNAGADFGSQDSCPVRYVSPNCATPPLRRNVANKHKNGVPAIRKPWGAIPSSNGQKKEGGLAFLCKLFDL